MKGCKRFVVWGVILLFISAGLLHAQDTLTVVHINDTHSHLVPWGPKDTGGIGTYGAIARAVSVIGQIQATEENVLFLHAGDVFIGDPMFNKYFGVPELQILASLGCDALTLGNHEFDLFPSTLVTALVSAGFPIQGFDLLSANLDMSLDPDLNALVDPYVYKDVAKTKIGIFGLTTETTNEFSNPTPDSVTSCLDGAVAAVTALSGNCDIIIGLTHLGVEVDMLIAANVPGIDVIVGGHSHDALFTPVGVTNPLGGTTWIVQAGCFYQYVGVLKIAKTGALGVEVIDYQLIPIDDTVPSEPVTAGTIETLVNGVEIDPRYGTIYSDIIAEAAVDMTDVVGSVYKDTPMGNLITDAFRDATSTDIALTVDGFISQGLYAGDLCGFDIFETVAYGYDETSGYGFGVMTYDLVGMALKLGLEYIIDMAKLESDLNIQVSGMTFVYNSDQPFGQKIPEVTIGSQPLDDYMVYSVTSNSGLYGFLGLAGLTPTNPVDTGLMEYEVVRDYIIANSPVNYTSEGRIEDVGTEVEEIAGKEIPSEFELSQNYPNPFNPETNVHFTLPKTAKVSLSVYNLLGQRVDVLVEDRLDAGFYTASWNAIDMPAGIYFCQLRSGKTTLTRRMVLVK